jgi:NAD(P)-dependent dehydrogenase (short-subunit alcohol dehydrogenase family)
MWFRVGDADEKVRYARLGMLRTKGAAIVTGAGRGIGRAIARDLAILGYPVGLQARTHSQLFDARAEIEALGGRARVVPGDVREPAAAEELVDRCEAELGPIQIAVGCAGRALSAPISKTSPDDMKALFEVNVMSAFHLIRAASRAMIASRTKGRIVIVASTAAIRGMRYTAAYSASKHAVLGLVRTAALELAKDGITVNALCPGWVRTEMLEATTKNIAEKTGCSQAEALQRIEEMIPMRRVLETEEVAALLRYVVSEEARHLTGQALVVDGGETTR